MGNRKAPTPPPASPKPAAPPAPPHKILFGYPIEFVDDLGPKVDPDAEPLELFGQYGTLTATNRRTGEQVVVDVVLDPDGCRWCGAPAGCPHVDLGAR